MRHPERLLAMFWFRWVSKTNRLRPVTQIRALEIGNDESSSIRDNLSRDEPGENER